MTAVGQDSWVRVLGSTVESITRTDLENRALRSEIEICGFIIDNRLIVEVPNTSDTPRFDFRIDGNDTTATYDMYGERITHMFHSHPSAQPYMSLQDAHDVDELFRLGCPWRYLVVTGDCVTEYRWIGTVNV